MIKKIYPPDLKGVVKKRSGFGGLNPGKIGKNPETGEVGCTPPWSRLQYIGNTSLPDINAEHLRPVELTIGQGGIRNTNISENAKTLFKTDVLPAIQKFAPDCGDTFHLLLHYREGLLSVVDLEYSDANQ